MVHDHVDIKKVKPLTNREYFARGMTALLDAIRKTINHAGNRHKYDTEKEAIFKEHVLTTKQSSWRMSISQKEAISK